MWRRQLGFLALCRLAAVACLASACAGGSLRPYSFDSRRGLSVVRFGSRAEEDDPTQTAKRPCVVDLLDDSGDSIAVWRRNVQQKGPLELNPASYTLLVQRCGAKCKGGAAASARVPLQTESGHVYRVLYEAAPAPAPAALTIALVDATTGARLSTTQGGECGVEQ